MDNEIGNFKLDDVKRNELSYNTLNECVIRVDFMKINDIDGLLEKLNKLLEGYDFRSNEVFNIDLEIHDPKTLQTQELIKNNVNKSMNWEYYTATEKFIINNYVLIFSKRIFNNYSGIGKYQEIFEKILEAIIKHEKNIKITRVGLRKKNIIFTKSDYDWKKIINADYIPNKYNEELDEINLSAKVLNEDANTYSFNNFLSVKKGTAKKDNEDLIVNRIICDIDFYKRIINKNKINLTEYNDRIFDMYKDMMNKNFIYTLKNGGLDEENIIWGININDNTKQ